MGLIGDIMLLLLLLLLLILLLILLLHGDTILTSIRFIYRQLMGAAIDTSERGVNK